MEDMGRASVNYLLIEEVRVGPGTTIGSKAIGTVTRGNSEELTEINHQFFYVSFSNSQLDTSLLTSCKTSPNWFMTVKHR